MVITFLHIFVVIIVIFVWKDENKRKRGRGWPILKNIIDLRVFGIFKRKAFHSDIATFQRQSNVARPKMDQHIFDIFVSAKGTNNFSWMILYLECDGYLQHKSQLNWNNRIIESLKHDLHMPGCAIFIGFVLTQNNLTSSRGLFNNHFNSYGMPVKV